MKNIFILLLALLTSACATKIVEKPRPPPQQIIDPSDEVLHMSMHAMLEANKAPKFTRYDFIRLDLNNDGRRDAMVATLTPYGYWCRAHGCTFIVMQAHNDHFTPIGIIQEVRPPIYVSHNKTNGWNDMAFRLSGRNNEVKKFVRVQFDGERYPQYNQNDIGTPTLEKAEFDKHLFEIYK